MTTELHNLNKQQTKNQEILCSDTSAIEKLSIVMHPCVQSHTVTQERQWALWLCASLDDLSK